MAWRDSLVKSDGGPEDVISTLSALLVRKGDVDSAEMLELRLRPLTPDQLRFVASVTAQAAPGVPYSQAFERAMRRLQIATVAAEAGPSA